MANGFSAESPENYQQKCCCVLVLDVSSSMQGAPIEELNGGLKVFYDDIQKDSTTADRLEISIVEFSDEVKTLIDPCLVANFEMPILKTKGTTKLVDGVREGMNIVRSRKSWYKQTGQPYYRPWIILITDGAPDAGQDINGLASEIKDAVAQKDFFFFSLGVEGADMALLNAISDASMPPAYLKGMEFLEFFKWLSASMTAVTNTKEGGTTNFGSPSSWMKGISV